MDEDYKGKEPEQKWVRQPQPANRQPLLSLLRGRMPDVPQIPVVPPERRRLDDLAQRVRGVDAQTPVTQRFLQTAQTVERRLAPEALSKLRGRADSLLVEEEKLKASSGFVTLMSKLREVEALGTAAESSQFAARDKLQALRQAAVELKDHYAVKYAKEVTGKPDSAHAKAHAAALQIIADIDLAAQQRQAAIDDFKRLMADLKAQVDLREQGGAVPVDFGAIGVLQRLNQGKDKPTEIDTVLSALLKRARRVEGMALMQEVGPPVDGFRAQACTALAEVCLKFGSAKPPGISDAGASDSFFLKGPDGTPAFVFKPMDGEADQSARGWEQGGAAVREVLASALDDQLAAIGLDCGIPKATVATLQDPAFKAGGKSQAEQRCGALLQFAPSDKSMAKLLVKAGPTVPDEDLPNYCDDPVEIARRKQLINKKDLHNIALFDIITLNLDRNPANLLTRREGSGPNETIRLIPIDGGNLMPPRAALGDGGINGLAIDLKAQDQHLGESNALMQLPQSTEPFDDMTAAGIDRLDPDAIVGGMREAYRGAGRSAPDMAGKVTEPEVFQMMKISMLILKKACGSTAQPRLSPADMAEMYFHDLMPLLDRALGPKPPDDNFQPLSEDQLKLEIEQMIARQGARKDENARLALVRRSIADRGGQEQMRLQGWNPTISSPMLLNDPDRALEILVTGEEEPSLLDEFRHMGGDGGMIVLGLDPQQFKHTLKKVEALRPLFQASEYQRLGADAGLREGYNALSQEIAAYRRDYLPWDEARRKNPFFERDAWAAKNPAPPTRLPAKTYQKTLDELLAEDPVLKLQTLQQIRAYLG